MPFPDDMGSSMFIYSFIYLIIIYTQLKKKELIIRYKKFQKHPKN